MVIGRAYRVQILLVACLILFTFIAPPAAAQLKDTLYFYNSSILVGELLNIRLGRAEFDADGVGVVKIKNKEIKSIRAILNEFRIETTEGEQLQGYLRSTRKDGRVIIHSLLESKEIDVSSITSLTKYGRTWKSGLSGNLSAGYTYTKSSEIGRLNFDGSIKYNSPRSEIKLQASTIITSDSIEVKRERDDVGLGYNYTMKNLWATGGGLKYQRNLELGLDRRYQEGLAIGRKLLVRRTQQAVVLTGIAFNQELNLEGVSSKNTEIVLQGNYELFSFEEPNLIISIAQIGYFSVTDKGRVRYDGNTTLNWELISDFYLNLQFYHNYDRKSPKTGEPNIDYGFVIGISYKFDGN
ncbi:MAG TPA: DUF481 domain-containing protein [Chryseolinea sp.]